MNEVNRRNFIKKSAIIGAGMAIIPSLSNSNSVFASAETIDISVVSGTNYFQSTINAVEQLGGISKFVPKGSSVGLLINAPEWWSKPGSHTNTDVVLATLKLLNDAGVKSITYLLDQSPDLYKRSELSIQYQSIIDSIQKSSGEYRDKELSKAIKMKNPQVVKELMDLDIFISIPVNKHHAGISYTGCLKNMMGACNRDTNMKFHTGGESGQDDAEHLGQCIADINLLRKPDLCIVDATVVLKTNGPAGPGELIKPNKVFAGTNPVSLDAYGCTLIGFKPNEIWSTKLANKHGLGEYDLAKINIKESTN
jgi:uncharacterized protein (DUF362 family)